MPGQTRLQRGMMNVRHCLGAPGRKADIQIKGRRARFEGRVCRAYRRKSAAVLLSGVCWTFF